MRHLLLELHGAHYLTAGWSSPGGFAALAASLLQRLQCYPPCPTDKRVSSCAASLQVTLVGPSNEARIIYPDLATCKGYIHGALHNQWTEIPATQAKRSTQRVCSLHGAFAACMRMHPVGTQAGSLLRAACCSSTPCAGCCAPASLTPIPRIPCSGGHPAAAPYPGAAGSRHNPAPAGRRACPALHSWPGWRWCYWFRRQWQLCAHRAAPPVHSRVLSMGAHGQQQWCAGACSLSCSRPAASWMSRGSASRLACLLSMLPALCAHKRRALHQALPQGLLPPSGRPSLPTHAAVVWVS